eukprot:RCo048987
MFCTGGVPLSPSLMCFFTNTSPAPQLLVLCSSVASCFASAEHRIFSNALCLPIVLVVRTWARLPCPTSSFASVHFVSVFCLTPHIGAGLFPRPARSQTRGNGLPACSRLYFCPKKKKI